MGTNGLIKKVLTAVGLDAGRFDLQWASAAEGPRFVKLITEFTAKIQKLGPLGAVEGLSPDEAKLRAEKALEMVSDRKLRMGFGNVTKALRKEVPNLSDEIIAQVIDEKLTKTISSMLG
jgi:hypothetical protein